MNRRIAIFVFCAALIMSSCTVPSVCDLYNNTGKEIQLELVHREGKNRLAGLAYGSIKSIKEWSSVRYIKVRVLSKTKETEQVWEYENPPVPEVKHWKWRGWWIFSRHYFNAQVDPNGEIHILGNDQSFPISPSEAVFTFPPKEYEK